MYEPTYVESRPGQDEEPGQRFDGLIAAVDAGWRLHDSCTPRRSSENRTDSGFLGRRTAVPWWRSWCGAEPRLLDRSAARRWSPSWIARDLW